MLPLRFVALPTVHARALQAGEPDANGRAPERRVSDGEGNPCRHCLRDIPKGAPMLVLAYRPFAAAAQPYAEQGPIFLCADACARHPEGAALPPVLASRERVMLRGYGPDDRIVYGTGAIVATSDLAAAAARLLERPDVAYAHVRSASYGCYQARVERA